MELFEAKTTSPLAIAQSELAKNVDTLLTDAETEGNTPLEENIGLLFSLNADTTTEIKFQIGMETSPSDNATLFVRQWRAPDDVICALSAPDMVVGFLPTPILIPHITKAVGVSFNLQNGQKICESIDLSERQAMLRLAIVSQTPAGEEIESVYQPARERDLRMFEKLLQTVQSPS